MNRACRSTGMDIERVREPVGTRGRISVGGDEECRHGMLMPLGSRLGAFAADSFGAASERRASVANDGAGSEVGKTGAGLHPAPLVERTDTSQPTHHFWISALCRSAQGLARGSGGNVDQRCMTAMRSTLVVA